MSSTPSTPTAAAADESKQQQQGEQAVALDVPAAAVVVAPEEEEEKKTDVLEEPVKKTNTREIIDVEAEADADEVAAFVSRKRSVEEAELVIDNLRKRMKMAADGLETAIDEAKRQSAEWNVDHEKLKAKREADEAALQASRTRLNRTMARTVLVDLMHRYTGSTDTTTYAPLMEELLSHGPSDGFELMVDTADEDVVVTEAPADATD